MSVVLTAGAPREWLRASALSITAVALLGLLAELGVWAWIIACGVLFAVIVTPRLLRDPWKILCFLILPVILTGWLGMFVVGKQTRITPSQVIVAPCIAISTIGLLSQGNVKFRQLPLFVPFCIYWTAVLLSGIPSVNKLHWIHGVLEVAMGYGFFLFGSVHLRTRAQLHLFLKLFIGLSTVMVVFGLLQQWAFDSVRQWFPLVYNQVDIVWLERWHENGRLAGNWTNPGHLGSILNLAAPIALYYYLEAETFQLRYFFTYTLIAFGIIMTGTRSTMIAFAVSGILLVSLIRRRLWRVFVPVTVFMLFLVAAAPFVIDSVSRFDLSNPGNDLSVQTRSVIQFETFLLFLRNPVLGIGYYNYPDRVFYADEGAQQAPHNVFLEHAAETGLVGISAFVIFLSMAFRSDFRRPRVESQDLRDLGFALLAACVATLVECFAENPLYVWQVAGLFWLFRGISLAIRTRAKDFAIPYFLPAGG